jgi:hypothetical protein
MGKKVIVENDKVEGTDKHNVSGMGQTIPPPPPVAPYPYMGVASFDYVGKMTGQLSDFVKIDGKPAAVKTSTSSLDPGESSPGGKHGGPQAKSPTPPLSTSSYSVQASALSIIDPVGTGRPSTTAGSSFVKIASVAVLLDSDKIDTCDGLSIPMNSTVAAGEQDFVSCSE